MTALWIVTRIKREHQWDTDINDRIRELFFAQLPRLINALEEKSLEHETYHIRSEFLRYSDPFETALHLYYYITFLLTILHLCLSPYGSIAIYTATSKYRFICVFKPACFLKPITFFRIYPVQVQRTLAIRKHARTRDPVCTYVYACVRVRVRTL